MTESSEYYTATMARLFAEQGYLRKAAEIYRQLVARNPENTELKAALVEIEADMTRQQAPTRKDAELLLREWIELLKQLKQKQQETISYPKIEIPKSKEEG